MTDRTDYTAAAGLNVAYTPPPPAVGLPVEPVAGAWGDYPEADDPWNPIPVTPDLSVNPVPLIGAIPFGGIVIEAATYSVSFDRVGAPQAVIIGSKGTPRPTVTGMLMYSAEAVGSFELVGDGQVDQVTTGFALPIGIGRDPIWFPIRRATIRATAAAAGRAFVLSVATIGYPTSDG